MNPEGRNKREFLAADEHTRPYCDLLQGLRREPSRAVDSEQRGC